MASPQILTLKQTPGPWNVFRVFTGVTKLRRGDCILMDTRGCVDTEAQGCRVRTEADPGNTAARQGSPGAPDAGTARDRPSLTTSERPPAAPGSQTLTPAVREQPTGLRCLLGQPRKLRHSSDGNKATCAHTCYPEHREHSSPAPQPQRCGYVGGSACSQSSATATCACRSPCGISRNQDQ